MKKRVLIFSTAYYPLVGGAEVAIKEITDRIGTREIEFHLITNRFDRALAKREQVGNVTVHRVGFAKKEPTAQDLASPLMYLQKILYVPQAFFKAIALDRRHRFDALWAVMSYAGFPVVFLKLFYRRKIPYVLTLQEGDDLSRHVSGRIRIRVVYPLFNLVFKKANVVQTISSYLADWAKSMGYTGPIEVIPNAVDTKKFAREYPKKELDALKGQLDKKDGSVFVITTSRLVKKNAVDDVIKSLKYLPKQVKFLVLGTGPDLKALEDLAAAEDVDNRVLFLGHVDHAEMPKYLQVSDIFIRPSLSEGMGNSFIEAMAAGIPVIATPVGGITDFLFDPQANPDKPPTGLFADVRDPKNISEKILRLMEDPTLSDVLTKNARRLVLEKYDWDLVAEDMREKVFERVA